MISRQQLYLCFIFVGGVSQNIKVIDIFLIQRVRLGYCDVGEIQVNHLLALQIEVLALFSKHLLSPLFECQFLIHLEEVIAINIIGINDIIPLRLIIVLIDLHYYLVFYIGLFYTSHFPLMTFVLVGEGKLTSNTLLKGDLMFSRVEQSSTFQIDLEMLVLAEHKRSHELLSAIKLPLDSLNI